jgi:hypothetical protein
VRFGIAATSKVSRSRRTHEGSASESPRWCASKTAEPRQRSHVYRMARNGRRRTSAPAMRTAVTADRVDYWIRLGVASGPPQSNVNPARDRRAALIVIGRLLKDRYDALATPVPPHLAALVNQLKNAEIGETSGYSNRYLHSDEWNRKTGSSSHRPLGQAPGRLCAS